MMRRLLFALLLAAPALAQIAIVQAKSVHADGTSPVTFTFTTAPAAHDLLVVGCSIYSSATVTAPDATWTRQANQTSADVQLSVWTHAVASGEANAYSFAQNNHTTCTAYDLSGAAYYGPINASATGFTSTASVTSLATPAVTPTVTGTLPLAFVAMDDDVVSAVGSPWTYTAPAAGGHSLGAAGHALTTDTTTAQAATFTVSGPNANGLAAATLLIAPYNSTPIAPIAAVGDINGPHYSGIPNRAILFDGSLSSDPKLGPLTYLWTFGDGATSTTVQPTHAYTATGTFNASLKVTNTDGLSNTATFTVIVQNCFASATLGLLGAIPCQLSPNDEWHRDVSAVPVDQYSSTLNPFIGASGFHGDMGNSTFGYYGIPYYVVTTDPSDPAHVNLSAWTHGSNGQELASNDYGFQSDYTLWPFQPNMQIEGNPGNCVLGGATQGTGYNDQHLNVFDRYTGVDYELYRTQLCNGTYYAEQGTVWDTTVSNQQRPFAFTSTDAAGTSVLSGEARYDEVATGAINHALRVTFLKVSCDTNGQPAFEYPGTHSSCNASMASGVEGAGFIEGQHWRLSASCDLSSLGPQALVIGTAMKKYGMIFADLGAWLYITGTPDPRWNDDDIKTLGNIPKSCMELVQQRTVMATNRYPSGTPPAIGSFAPAQPVLTTGQCTTLNFAVTGASYQYIDLVGFVRSAPTVCPTVTTTYTLTASNYFLVGDDGSGDGTRPTASATVTVLPAIVPFFSGNVIVGEDLQ